jgi:hypothetical protein
MQTPIDPTQIDIMQDQVSYFKIRLYVNFEERGCVNYIMVMMKCHLTMTTQKIEIKGPLNTHFPISQRLFP